MVMAGKFLLGGAIAVTIVAGAIAWASTSVVQSTDLASGLGTVAACDHAPHWSYTFSKDTTGRVSDVHVTGIASSCLGGSMHLALVGPSYVADGESVTITTCATSCSVTVPFTLGPLPSQVTTVDAVVVGP